MIMTQFIKYIAPSAIKVVGKYKSVVGMEQISILGILK